MKKLLSLPLLSIFICIASIAALNKFFPTSITHRPPTLYLFSHGIANTYRQAYNYVKTYSVDGQTYSNERYILQNPFFSFDYPDATTRFWRVNFWKTSLGQDNEIEALHKAYHTIVSEYKKKHVHPHIVISGVSRGASTIINFLGKHNPTYVKAVILESPFDHGSSIVDNMLQRFNIKKSERSNKFGHNMLSMIFKQYQINGIQPIDAISSIKNKQIPILIICSKQDQLVPWHSSKKLYDKLKTLGYQNAHILILNKGAHDNILLGSEGHIYQQVAHAFYAQYGLQYNNETAFCGKNIFTKCQP